MPVLFLPGNAGSYAQVRSLASETARQVQRACEAAARRADATSTCSDAVRADTAADGCDGVGIVDAHSIGSNDVKHCSWPTAEGQIEEGGGGRYGDLAWYAADFNEELSAFDGKLLVRVSGPGCPSVLYHRSHQHSVYMDPARILSMWSGVCMNTSRLCIPHVWPLCGLSAAQLKCFQLRPERYDLHPMTYILQLLGPDQHDSHASDLWRQSTRVAFHWRAAKSRGSTSTFEPQNLSCGPAQELQTQFAVDCVRHLWKTHEAVGTAHDEQRRVLLVGHSMGGIVARAALSRLATEPGFGTASFAPMACGSNPYLTSTPEA